MNILEILNAPWAIVPEKYSQIKELYEHHAHGEKVDLVALEASMGKKLENSYRSLQVVDGIAMLPIEGVIAKRMNLFAEISGGTSSQLMQRDFSTAMEDPLVHSIMLLIDSPGGEVSGTQEFCNEVFAARGLKPIVAVCSGMMASAAYWIASSADEVYVTADTDVVGSIGVLATHTDNSEAEAKSGKKITTIAAGKYKTIGNPHEPLSAEGRAEIQSQVDQIYTVFVNDVARNRNTSAEKVLADMAEGRVFIGQKAVAAGLVDGKKTTAQVFTQLQENRHQMLFGKRTSATALNSTGGSSMKETPAAAAVPADIEAMQRQHFDTGFKAGAEAERARIQAVESQAMPGHEALVATMKFDGKTTGPEAAVAILAAERKKLGNMNASLHAEAPKPAPNAPAEDTTKKTPQAVNADMSRADVDAIAKKEWADKPELHREFSSEGSYLAFRYQEAQGRIRILRDKTKVS